MKREIRHSHRYFHAFIISYSLFCAPCALLLSPFYLWATPQKPAVIKKELSNGIRVLLYPRHQFPAISFRVIFRVGAVDDEMGQTGLAHLFEHMAFKGTQTLNTKDFKMERAALDKVEQNAQELIREQSRRDGGRPDHLARLKSEMKKAEDEADLFAEKDEYEMLYESYGSWDFNAFTSHDLTGYTVSLPANRLDHWLAIESDRFRNPVFREFYRERSVVMEERRMRTDSDPFGKLLEVFFSQSFSMSPYHRAVVGWMSDLQRVTATQAEKFYRSHYTPDRMVFALVGDFDPDATLKKLERYFGSISANSSPPDFPGDEPPQAGERRCDLAWDAEPMLLMGWHKPATPHSDDARLKLLSGVLSSGRTSRFYKNLVEKQGIARSVSSGADEPGDRFSNLFVVFGVPRPGHDAASLERAVEGEIEAVKKTPPQSWELERVRNDLEADLVRVLARNEGLASTIAMAEASYDDWAQPWKFHEQLAEIKPEELSDAAKRYLTQENKTVALLIKKR